MNSVSSPTRPSDLERIAHNILPGGWAVEQQRPIATLLGSCVAVCLYDPLLKLAGMNHFLLPFSHNKTDVNAILFGDYAMEVLLNAMYAKGAAPSRLQAKAFGGGNIVDALQVAIGQRNAEFAQEWLERQKIPLLAHDFGGPWSRKVIIDPANGDVFCRRTLVNSAEAHRLIENEKRYQETLLQRKISEEANKKIELF